ncbi:MAG: hypothetical protein EAZ70_10085 [Runella slithyformis]|nr:MAG: hypothetical protein EAY79_10830 [Runella slithyformis]TAF25485.1 MAG: hypothetical protein EAZ70_10085 [Runella slithyformis]TAF43805.1 MAG: hypothetical protein EAZ63_13265 [Runella slithyformis]TAF79883.1 MAG: hypothetical protein EAZ50_10190 [Runella slithyformis]
MKKIFNFKTLWPHLVVVIGFAILSLGYMSPVLKGKTLQQSDPTQFIAQQTEIRSFAAESGGEYSGWTNSVFGGIPTYFIGEDYAQGIFIKIQPYLYYLLGLQGSYIFFYLVGAYLLLLALGCGLWPSVLGAIGYGFFSYNLQIIVAGHLAKIYALAFAPIMLAGLVMAFRGRPWAGMALFSFGLGLELNANHFQITYYTAFIIAVLGIFELIRALKEKQVGNFVLSAVLAVVLGVLVTATNTARLWTTYDHSKETIRGGSELVKDVKKDTTKAEGLDKDYAFSWSYGKLETLTFLIPDFAGGSSGGELDEKSEAFKTLMRYNIPADNAAQVVRSLPTYWGDQTFVSGGIYAGAILCFLFVLGLFFAEKRYKYPFAVSALLCLFIGWGSNFSLLNYFLFDYFPLYNKFRAVSMILSLTQLCMVVVAVLGLKTLLQNTPTWANFKKPFFVSLGLTAGVALLLALVPSLVGLRSANDPAFLDNMTQSFGNNRTAASDLYAALLDDRAAMLRSDAFRSVLFILLAAAVVWALVTKKIKNTAILMATLSFLTLVDLWVVNKRYLNADDFQPKVSSYEDLFQPSAADQQILQDRSYYRVLDLTGNPFSNARPSAYHKSVGGYMATKLQRFQDLIEGPISKNNMAVLNMLNTKYFITAGQDGQPAAQQNPDAMGNVWFVREVKMVNNANEEMAALDSLKPGTTVVIDKRFANILKDAKPIADTSAKIRLISYKPNVISYESDTKALQIAVFSEIYYKGNEDWKSYIDGQEVPHFRANYVLRGLVIPAGKHIISFKFDPVTVKQGAAIDRWASLAWLLLVGFALFMDYRSRHTAQA